MNDRLSNARDYAIACMKEEAQAVLNMIPSLDEKL